MARKRAIGSFDVVATGFNRWRPGAKKIESCRLESFWNALLWSLGRSALVLFPVSSLQFPVSTIYNLQSTIYNLSPKLHPPVSSFGLNPLGFTIRSPENFVKSSGFIGLQIPCVQFSVSTIYNLQSIIYNLQSKS